MVQPPGRPRPPPAPVDEDGAGDVGEEGGAMGWLLLRVCLEGWSGGE